MYRNGSHISCGITELGNFGSPGGSFVSRRRIQENIRSARNNRYRLVLSSLNRVQEPMEPVLFSLGFEKVSDWGINPNSGNEIALYVLDLNKKRKRSKCVEAATGV